MVHPLSTLFNDTSSENLIFEPIPSFTDSEDIDENNNETIVLVLRQDLLVTGLYLKLHSLLRASNSLDATVVDYTFNPLRFNLLYFIQSWTTNFRFIVSTWASETHSALSIQSIYPAFNWSEREVWDLFGLFFVKHPDLRRILTDYGFMGHPLRKDYPLTGFKEVQYEDLIKHVEYSNTELAQSFRLLSFNKPWATHEEKKQKAV